MDGGALSWAHTPHHTQTERVPTVGGGVEAVKSPSAPAAHKFRAKTRRGGRRGRQKPERAPAIKISVHSDNHNNKRRLTSRREVAGHPPPPRAGLERKPCMQPPAREEASRRVGLTHLADSRGPRTPERFFHEPPRRGSPLWWCHRRQVQQRSAKRQQRRRGRGGIDVWRPMPRTGPGSPVVPLPPPPRSCCCCKVLASCR